MRYQLKGVQIFRGSRLYLKKPKRIIFKKNRKYGIFESDVSSKDKYKVGRVKTYKTRTIAKKQIKKMVKRGWKKNELKILSLNYKKHWFKY